MGEEDKCVTGEDVIVATDIFPFSTAALLICCFTESTWNFLTNALTLGGVSEGALRRTFGVVGASGKRTSVLE